MTFDPRNGIPSLTVYDTIVGCEYRLVYKESVTSVGWNPVVLPAGAWQSGGGTLTFADPGAAGQPHRFYSVEVR